jgi:hypothetical protein
MQKFRILLNTDDAPTPKARKSVIDVIVMATALFCIMKRILSLIGSSGVSFILDKDGASAIPDIKINISSIPMPAKVENNKIHRGRFFFFDNPFQNWCKNLFLQSDCKNFMNIQ